MICVYDIGSANYQNNGDAILIPTKCTIKNIAAGQYDLTMEHPIDPDGKWVHLQPEAIIKAPIPEEMIENAFAGMEADVYVTTEEAALREGPAESVRITYSTWSITANYGVGSKVTWYNNNYQCTYWDDDDATHKHLAPSGSTWWKRIANYTDGYPALVTLKSGTDLYYVSGPDDGWYYMSTTYGLEGYIKSSQITYSRHLTPSETKNRIITTQLFRIKKVTVDTKNMSVSVTAEHVSYDLNGVLMDDVNIVRKTPAYALAMIGNAFMIDYPGTIASNIVTTTDRTYTAKLSGKNGMFALLDPDKGVVSQFEAAFRRDNWDLFVMEKTSTDQGFHIRYGNNMLGVNWKIGSDQLITRIVPVAKDEDGNDLFISDYTKFVDSQYINNYPRIRMERLKVNGQVGKDDGSETATNWTVQTLRAEMQSQADARFSVDKCDQLKHEITIDFVRLGDTEEYKQFKDLQKVRLYDTVIAVDPRIDLSVSVQVIEIEFDAINERITAMKLSNIEAYNVRNTAGFNVLNNSITRPKLTDETEDGIIGDAVDESNEYTDAETARTLSASKSYTNTKAEETLESSKTYTSSYVGSKGGYGTFESYIKAYCDNRYERKSSE